MSANKEEALGSILDLSANSIWSADEQTIAQLWEEEKKSESFAQSEEKLLNIIRLAYEVVHFNPENEREAAKFQEGWTIFSRTNPAKGNVAIRKRTIRQLTDLSYENIKHISAATLLELISRNFGGGWDSIPLSIKDIIESSFDVSTSTLPSSRIHMPGGTLEKKVADGYEVLEVAKGSWTEAIFAKKKTPNVKLRFVSEPEYDEDGNRLSVPDEEREDEDREEEEEVQPTEDDTFYSTYAAEAEVKDEDEDETAGLSVLE
ncbi:MAG: hypothetical protein IKR98_05590 [Bacteroidaceae bacterium]|nr:hypothetical protein [Bacteroidaceae bacterium]MBR4243347.1 hypothetical protein [Bacteroidaceae bacterium]